MLHITKVKPLFTSIVTTADKFDKDEYENGLIIAKEGDLKIWQKVIAVGSSVRDIKVGDLVMVDVSHYAVKKYDPNSVKNDMGMNKTIKFAFNWVTIYDDKDNPHDCLLLTDRDIMYVFEGKEVDETPKVITGGKKLILPKTKKVKAN